MWVEAEQPGAPSGEPLGELLVSRGLLTHEQLEQALAEQSSCKRPLGEVIVRLGFTTGPTIAQALATQHGRIFKSEYGFATGFDATLDVPEIDAPPVTTRQDGRLTLAPPPAGTDDQADTPGDRSQEPPPSAEPQPEPSAELAAAETQLNQLAEQLTNAAGRIVNAEMARDTALRTTDETKAAYAALAQENEQLAARVETLESELAETQTAVKASQRTRERQEGELRQRIAQAEKELNEARRERDEAKTQLYSAEDTNRTLHRQHEAERQERALLEQPTASVTELEERLAGAEAETLPRTPTRCHTRTARQRSHTGRSARASPHRCQRGGRRTASGSTPPRLLPRRARIPAPRARRASTRPRRRRRHVRTWWPNSRSRRQDRGTPTRRHTASLRVPPLSLNPESPPQLDATAPLEGRRRYGDSHSQKPVAGATLADSAAIDMVVSRGPR